MQIFYFTPCRDFLFSLFLLFFVTQKTIKTSGEKQGDSCVLFPFFKKKNKKTGGRKQDPVLLFYRALFYFGETPKKSKTPQEKQSAKEKSLDSKAQRFRLFFFRLKRKKQTPRNF